MGIFSVIYSFVDSKQAVSTTEIPVPDSFSLVQISGFAIAMAPIIDALVKGKITRIGVVLAVTLPGGIKTEPTLGADVEEGAEFQFNSVGGFFKGMRLPTFDEQFVAGNSKAVIITEPEVAAFTAAMQNGIATGGATVTPCDARGADIISLSYAKESFQNSRRK